MLNSFSRLRLSKDAYCALILLLSTYCLAQKMNDAGSRAASVLDSMPPTRQIDQVAISPDGSRVAYVTGAAVSVVPASGGAAQSVGLPSGNSAREVAWSPDSKRLAIIVDVPGDVPHSQLWLADAGTLKAHRLAELNGYAQTPSFSPDGRRLALLFISGIPRIAGPLQPMTPLAGVVDEKIYEQRITLVDLNSGALKPVTPADMYVYEYDWTPDGSGWAATAAHGSGDNNWWIARLYLADTASGQMRELYAPKLQICQPRVSPDGKQVAFIEGLMSDAGLNGGDIHVVSTAGGEARDITPGIKASPSTLNWKAQDRITFGEFVDGKAGFATVSPDGGSVQTLWTGAEWAATDANNVQVAASLAQNGTSSAVIRQSSSAPPEVWAGEIGKWQKLTTLNAEVKPAWGEARNVHWDNGGEQVQGWLLLPKDYDAAKRYPLVVSVHGGPSYACASRFDDKEGEYSAMEYFTLCPNPRGSFGSGEAFTQSNVKDFGGGDFRDIMAGIDAIAKEYPIDQTKLGIRGHSYGGYMTMWAETQTTRFRAAVAGAGISDWLSYYGLNDIDEWMIPFFGASIYDDPAVYAKSDPMHFVKNVKTPTLILVGDRDGEVPMPQSVEWWHALKTLGVPTELVVYANEGHAISKPADARDYQLRTLEWFEQWFSKPEAK